MGHNVLISLFGYASEYFPCCTRCKSYSSKIAIRTYAIFLLNFIPHGGGSRCHSCSVLYVFRLEIFRVLQSMYVPGFMIYVYVFLCPAVVVLWSVSNSRTACAARNARTRQVYTLLLREENTTNERPLHHRWREGGGDGDRYKYT